MPFSPAFSAAPAIYAMTQATCASHGCGGSLSNVEFYLTFLPLITSTVILILSMPMFLIGEKFTFLRIKFEEVMIAVIVTHVLMGLYYITGLILMFWDYDLISHMNHFIESHFLTAVST